MSKKSYSQARGSSRRAEKYEQSRYDDDDRMSVATQETKYDDDMTIDSSGYTNDIAGEPFDMTVR